MKTLYLLAVLFICGCQSIPGTQNISKEKAFNLKFDEILTLTERDSFVLESSRYKNGFPQFSDSTNSFCQLLGDTLKFYLSTGMFEGSYSLDIRLASDTFNTSFKLFDNHSKYNYSPTYLQITLNRKLFQV